MNKRIIALVLVLALCLTSAVAFAATGSRTTSNVTTTPKTEDPATVAVGAPTAESKAEMEEIANFVNEGKPVVEFFEPEVKDEIAAAVPGVDVATLKMDEYVPLAVVGNPTGSITLTLSTAASYSKDDAVVTMVGFMVNGKKVWKPVKSTIVDGKLVLDIPAELVGEITAGNATLMVLSNKNA